MLTKQTKFILVILFQLSLILGMIGFKELILIKGREVLLKIQPVDPRDPLRGDYLTFEYEISTLPKHFFRYSPIRNGDTVYVPLRKVEKYWKPVPGIQKTKPVDAEIFIKGKVASGGVGEEIIFFGISRYVRPHYVYIVYGIEEYFIPEGVGREFNWRKETAALVSIDENGNAVLKQLFVEDKPWP